MVTGFWCQKLPFGLKNNLMGQITHASWPGKRNIPFLRGCSRVARQAPMWVVVRPARSEKKATCCSYGSVNMQQGGAWGRRRRRGGVIFIFGAEVLKVKVIPAICTYKFCGLCSYHQCLMRGRWTRKYSQCLFNKPNSEIQPLHCSPKRTIEIIKSKSQVNPFQRLESEPSSGAFLNKPLFL